MANGGLDLQDGAVVLVGQDVEQTVRPLLDVADALPEFDEDASR